MEANDKIVLSQAIKKICSEPNVSKDELISLMDSFLFLVSEGVGGGKGPTNGVISVSGPKVDNTDPQRPIIGNPTLEDLGGATSAQRAKADTAVQPEDLGSAAFSETSEFATSEQGARADTAVQSSDLGSAAYEESSSFATATQGAKADTAVQPESLGSAATQDSNAFATAAQGAKADTAVQPGSLGSAAYAESSSFATSSQGAKADTAIQSSDISEVARTGEYQDLEGKPIYNFLEKDFSLAVVEEVNVLSFNHGTPAASAPTSNITLKFDRPYAFGSIASLKDQPVIESSSEGAIVGVSSVVYATGSLTALDSIFKKERGSEDYDAGSINVMEFTYHSSTFIGYRIKVFSYDSQNFALRSNTFSNFTVWEQEADVTRTQQGDGSWILNLPAGGWIGQNASIPTTSGDTEYTLSFKIKDAPEDLKYFVQAMPGFTTILDQAVTEDFDGSEFKVVKMTMTVPTSKTSLYLDIESVTGGEVAIRDAHLYRGPSTKDVPYIETTTTAVQ